uniref:Bromo domain-containing protein n=1 Tax=Heterorhabditis bacteriophora TaxID=37862 RepID=A0A1I7XHG9_HETBA
MIRLELKEDPQEKCTHPPDFCPLAGHSSFPIETPNRLMGEIGKDFPRPRNMSKNEVRNLYLRLLPFYDVVIMLVNNILYGFVSDASHTSAENKEYIWFGKRDEVFFQALHSHSPYYDSVDKMMDDSKNQNFISETMSVAPYVANRFIRDAKKIYMDIDVSAPSVDVVDLPSFGKL